MREKNLNKTIGALHISDGTLRFLLLETVFLNPNKGAFIAIDEPERGLHPDMIRSVAEMIKSAAQNSQLIIATHSPHLLNQFDLDDVIVFEKDETNSTLIKKLSDSDFSDYDGQLLPGQLWLNGEIGGKRW
ncbi:MAG: AAA family ATPase [Treponema sp.]|nr:AAA family ATPase [Treponema sp.]